MLVNNAGYYLFGDTESIQEEAARKQMDTNFSGSADVTLDVLRVLRDVNPQNGGPKGGLIVQISSSSGFVGLTGSAYYNARYVCTKHRKLSNVALTWNSQ